MAVDAPTANLVGFMLEMIAFGAYIVLFIEHSKLMYKRRVSTWAFSYQAATSILMAILIVMHMGIDFKRTLDAFTKPLSYTVDASGRIQGLSPADFFRQLNTFQTRLRTGIYSGITILADMFMVYRVFVVWGYNWYIACIPFVFFMASIGIATWHNLALYQYVPGVSFEHAQVTVAIMYFYSATLILNATCTGLISGRIWWVRRSSERYRIRKARGNYVGLRALVVTLLESAVLYSFLMIVMIVTSVTGSLIMFTILNLISPVIGIIFSSIIVRTSSPSAEPGPTLHSDNLSIRNQRQHIRDGVQIHLETISRTDDLMASSHGTRNYSAGFSTLDNEELKENHIVDAKDGSSPVFAF